MASCNNSDIRIDNENREITKKSADKKSHISHEECNRLKKYCIRKGFNPDVCILVDFSEYSGNERLYIYNLNKNCIKESGRVAHGIGKKGLFSKASFSNVPESWESSLGRYRIGRLRTLNNPRFKNVTCLEVHGLDPTNSNAHKRGIVIHPGLLTSRKTVTPCEPLSQGCFTVGQDTFEAIKSLTLYSSKPILLYAYK
ncbi:MAG: murein L,D-transpeptidase catalytic domain family protein, partial [Muribaculaceae bacterium]|nr:murein L,D-transpeptidase catalytic domain family protein [Muribaculaceae bacterium]